MRAYRFAAVLGFNLDGDTRKATAEGAQNLHKIAAERIQTEFTKLILSSNFDKIAIFFEDIGGALFPEIARLRGFAQNTPYHVYDVYDHSMAALAATKPTLPQRLAALYHDTGKFETRTTDQGRRHHFYGHAKVSLKIAEKALLALRYDNATISRTLDIIRHHDADARGDRRLMKRFLHKHGAALALDILDFQIADNAAKSELARNTKLAHVIEAKALLQEIIAAGEPTRTADLDISGRDVMRILNIPPGAAVGAHLARLMEHVLEDASMNRREKLIELLKEQV